MKLHDTIGRNSKNKEDKDPRFQRLEFHRKKVVLNASATPPFDSEALSPKQNFTYLSSQRKANSRPKICWSTDSKLIRFLSTQTLSLWPTYGTANFSGLFLDSPSGVSIFYCQETMSTIAYELEKDRYLALVDRVKATDMKKYQNRKLTDLQLLWILPGWPKVSRRCYHYALVQIRILQSS